MLQQSADDILETSAGGRLHDYGDLTPQKRGH